MMAKRNMKRFIAIALGTTMAVGSTMTAFAADLGGDGDDTTTSEQGVAEGEGQYEGGELKYPELQVSLPTIPAGTYNYIADPNGLISKTTAEDGTIDKYENSTFTGSTGIFFLTSTADDGTKTYSENSAALSVTNENAQDIDVSVKLEQKQAGDPSIQFAESATFESDDTANKLYLAITDGEAQDPNIAALSANGVATVKTKVEGVAENYEPAYSEQNGYSYEKKADDELVDWNDCSFNLTGAINTAAKWGDDVAFPTIKVTWSYAEHRDSALSSDTISQAANTVTVTDATVTGVKLVKANGSEVACSSGTHYTFKNGVLSITASLLGNNVGGKLKVTLDTGITEEIAIQ